MTILTKNEIIKALKKRDVKIEPLNLRNIGPGSIDLTLDNRFRVFKNNKTKLALSEDMDYKKLSTEKFGPLILNPGEFVLGITKEKITLPSKLCGFLSGRSRFARLGILVHATASFIQPGISNKQVLEIYNLSQRKIILKEGLRICQLCLQKTKGKALYQGRFKKQLSP